MFAAKPNLKNLVNVDQASTLTVAVWRDKLAVAKGGGMHFNSKFIFSSVVDILGSFLSTCSLLF